jgi:hypothetical protein
MPELDHALTTLISNAERPVFVDPDLLGALLKRQTRRQRARRATTTLIVVALVGLVAGGVAISNRSARNVTRPTATNSAVHFPQPVAAAPIPGVPFPACHVTSIDYIPEPLGDQRGFANIYLFGRGPASGPCPELDGENTYLGLNVGQLGPGPEPSIFGPIECFQGCRIFGAADIDGDGHSELAVVVDDGDGVDRVELYRFNPHGKPPFKLITTTVAGSRVSVSFDWKGVGDHRAGATCLPGSGRANGRPTGAIEIWTANLRGGRWHVLERIMHLEGSSLVPDRPPTYTATTIDRLPDGGGSELCGWPVST